MHRKSSIKPPGLIYFKYIWSGGLDRDRGIIWEGALFNLAETMVSVLHKELEYKVEKLKYKKVGGHAAEDQKQIWTSSWWINHPGLVHTKFYIRN